METMYLPTTQLATRDVGSGVHELEGVCVPYDTPTTKIAGGAPELFRAGAFTGALGNVGKVRLTDENHAAGRRPVGVASELRDDPTGLYGRFRFYDTPEGRAAWENVREGTYGGLSIGFVPVRERMSELGREVLEARLFHVSLVDDPAYDDAQVLAVRTADRWPTLRTTPRRLELPPDADTPLIVRISSYAART